MPIGRCSCIKLPLIPFEFGKLAGSRVGIIQELSAIIPLIESHIAENPNGDHILAFFNWEAFATGFPRLRGQRLVDCVLPLQEYHNREIEEQRFRSDGKNLEIE